MKKSKVIQEVFFALKGRMQDRILELKRELHPMANQFTEVHERGYKIGNLEEAQNSLGLLIEVTETMWLGALKEEQE